MSQYKTLLRSAGRHNFVEGQLIDLPDDEAEILIAAGAIKAVGDDPPDDDPPSEADSIRAEIAKSPEASNREIVATLKEQGVDVTSGQVTATRKTVTE